MRVLHRQVVEVLNSSLKQSGKLVKGLHFRPLIPLENLLITVEHFSHVVDELKGAVVLALLHLEVDQLQTQLGSVALHVLTRERTLERSGARIFSKLL